MIFPKMFLMGMFPKWVHGWSIMTSLLGCEKCKITPSYEATQEFYRATCLVIELCGKHKQSYHNQTVQAIQQLAYSLTKWQPNYSLIGILLSWWARSEQGTLSFSQAWGGNISFFHSPIKEGVARLDERSESSSRALWQLPYSFTIIAWTSSLPSQPIMCLQF